MKIRDSMTLDASGLKLTRDGYLVGEARVSRAGNVQQYLGSEIGLTGDDASKTWGVYRDPDVVFDENSMMSLAGRPVTRGHPPDGVSANSWRDLSVGHMGGTVRRDGEHVIASMAIMDAKAAKEVSEGARSLSAGYTVDVMPGDGTTENGESYQYRQSGDLRFNHVAYLPDNNPRAGNTRIGDGAADGGKDRAWGIAPLNHDHKPEGSTMTMITVVMGDKAVQVAASDAPAIETFKSKMADAMNDATKNHATAIEAKDTEIAKIQAELDDTKGKVMDAAALDKRVQDRAELVGKASAIAKDLKTAGVADADIRKAAVVAKLGDEAVKDKSQAYIDARFDILVEDSDTTTDPLRTAGSVKSNDGASAWGDSAFKSAGVAMKKGA